MRRTRIPKTLLHEFICQNSIQSLQESLILFKATLLKTAQDNTPKLHPSPSRRIRRRVALLRLSSKPQNTRSSSFQLPKDIENPLVKHIPAGVSFFLLASRHSLLVVLFFAVLRVFFGGSDGGSGRITHGLVHCVISLSLDRYLRGAG